MPGSPSAIRSLSSPTCSAVNRPRTAAYLKCLGRTSSFSLIIPDPHTTRPSLPYLRADCKTDPAVIMSASWSLVRLTRYPRRLRSSGPISSPKFNFSDLAERHDQTASSLIILIILPPTTVGPRQGQRQVIDLVVLIPTTRSRNRATAERCLCSIAIGNTSSCPNHHHMLTWLLEDFTESIRTRASVVAPAGTRY